MRWLKKILGFKAPKASIYMSENPKYIKYQVGDYTYGKPEIYGFGENLKIGRYCSIGPNVTFLLGGNHRVDWVSTYPFNALYKEFEYIKGHPSSKGEIVIKNDVWLGAESMILSGVTIGNGAVIGSRSVVTKSIPAYAIAVGNPAKVIKYRFSDIQISKLEDSKWWELDYEELKEFIPSLQNDKIDEFLTMINGKR